MKTSKHASDAPEALPPPSSPNTQHKERKSTADSSSNSRLLGIVSLGYRAPVPGRLRSRTNDRSDDESSSHSDSASSSSMPKTALYPYVFDPDHMHRLTSELPQSRFQSPGECLFFISGPHSSDEPVEEWDEPGPQVLGKAVSTYPTMPDPLGRLGDPVADAYLCRIYEHAQLFVLADGCGWGHGSRTAAHTATRVFADALAHALPKCRSMAGVGHTLLIALAKVHNDILKDKDPYAAGATTVVAGVAVKLMERRVAVSDSPTRPGQGREREVQTADMGLVAYHSSTQLAVAPMPSSSSTNQLDTAMTFSIKDSREKDKDKDKEREKDKPQDKDKDKDSNKDSNKDANKDASKDNTTTKEKDKEIRPRPPSSPPPHMASSRSSLPDPPPSLLLSPPSLSSSSTLPLPPSFSLSSFPSSSSRKKWNVVLMSLGDCKIFRFHVNSRGEGHFSDITLGNRTNLLDATDSGGRVGPATGPDHWLPDLGNLKLSCVDVAERDLIFAVSDGVHDNLEPIILGKTPREFGIECATWAEAVGSAEWVGRVMEVKNEFMCAELKRVLLTEAGCAPAELTPERVTKTLIRHSLERTQKTREFMEQNPGARQPTDYTEFPGKLDHASCICFVVKDSELEEGESKSGGEYSN